MDQLIELSFLFLSALLAATIFPAQSEMVLTGLHLTGQYSMLLLLLIATIGNVLGSLLNWLLGRYLIHFKDRKWFPFKSSTIEKSVKLYQKWGLWSLLFAWLPIIGDPLTLIAGILKTNLYLFLLLVTIGKALRYFILLALLST